MAKYFEDPGLQARIGRKCREARFITAPSAAPKRSRSDATRHGDLENDGFTLTSVAMRLLDTVPGKKPPEAETVVTADHQPPGSGPVMITAELRPIVPEVPVCGDGRTPPEIGEASKSRTTATLEMAEYEPLPAGRSQPKRGGKPWAGTANGKRIPASVEGAPSLSG